MNPNFKINFKHRRFASGYYKSVMNHMNHCFHVKEEYKEEFDVLFLRVWDLSYAKMLLSGISDGMITLPDSGGVLQSYCVIWTGGLTPARLKQLPAGARIAFSFRHAAPEWNLPAAVVVKEWKD